MIGQCVSCTWLHRSVRSPMLIFIAIFVYLRPPQGPTWSPFAPCRRRAGRRPRHDANRDAHAGLAHRRGYLSSAAHQPERIPIVDHAQRRSVSCPAPTSSALTARPETRVKDRHCALPDLRRRRCTLEDALSSSGKGRARSRRARWCGPAGGLVAPETARRNAEIAGPCRLDTAWQRHRPRQPERAHFI